MNVSNDMSGNLRTDVAAAAATKFLTMLSAALMLAAAADLHLYRLYRLMSESKFAESLHGGQDAAAVQAALSSNQYTFSAPIASRPSTLDRVVLHAKEPDQGVGRLVLVNRRHRWPAEGPRR